MTMKYHENIIAFLAQRGTGKTTLSAYLSQDVNWQIISEDMLIVNYNTLDLYASARKLLLRENALEILCKYGFSLEYEYNKIMNRYLLKECSEGSSGNNIMQKLTHIAFLERSLKKTPAITTIHEDSVGDILVNTLCPYQIKNNLTGAHELNKKCSKFHIQYEDMSLLKSTLQNFL